MKKTCSVPPGTSAAFSGRGLTRRRFLGVTSAGIVVSTFGRADASPTTTAARPRLQGTARNCVFVFLEGGPSHVDMWDFKEWVFTPKDFEPDLFGATRFPRGLLPKTTEQLDKIAIVRSGLAWALVHPLAQQWSQIFRNPTAALGAIAPHIGSVVSLELDALRKPADVLPTFVALNTSWVNVASVVGSGYLPGRHGPFTVTRPDGRPLARVVHPEGLARFHDRRQLAARLLRSRGETSPGRGPADMSSFFDQAENLTNAPDVAGAFELPPDVRFRYGTSAFGDAMATACNLVAVRRGVRFVQVGFDGWDNHQHIYSKSSTPSLRSQCADFDPAFGAFLSDLSALPGEAEGKTLLDETLVVVFGEFGRTVGKLNVTEGRDHFPRMSIVFAGGGVRGGRIIGQTDEVGAGLVEPGWSENRDVRPEDVAATVYSALGIDYTTVRHDDPLGRGFEYVPFAKDGVYKAVDELF